MKPSRCIGVAVRCIPGEALLRQKLERAFTAKLELNDPPIHNHQLITADFKDSRGHILVYIDYPGIYGAGQINHTLMTAYAGAGYRVTCVQHPASNYLIRERTRSGIGHVWLERDSIYDRTRIPLALTNVDEAKSVFRFDRAGFHPFRRRLPAVLLRRQKSRRRARYSLCDPGPLRHTGMGRNNSLLGSRSCRSCSSNHGK